MRAFDLVILLLCCVFWGANFVVSAWAVGNNPVPPFMLAATRAAIVLLIMAPFLFRQRPAKFWRLLVVCACVGPIHLGFLYTGLQTATASASSIIAQTLIPMAAILSVVFLGERIGRVRLAGILGALIGTLIMIYEPGALTFDMGLIYILFAYVALAVGSVVMKTVGQVDWRQYVVWMAAMVLVTMVIASTLFETGQADVWAHSRAPLLIAAGYAAIMVTVFSHGQYFSIMQKYEVSQVVPITLMTTFFATAFGVIFLGDAITPRMIIGAGFILPCVYVIARRQNTAVLKED